MKRAIQKLSVRPEGLNRKEFVWFVFLPNVFLRRFWLKVRILARNTQLPGVQRVLERRPAAACFGPKRALRAKIAVETHHIERRTKQIPFG